MLTFSFSTHCLCCTFLFNPLNDQNITLRLSHYLLKFIYSTKVAKGTSKFSMTFRLAAPISAHSPILGINKALPPYPV